MKVAIASRVPQAEQVIRQLLSPWKVTFTSMDEADVSIVYGENPQKSKKTIVIPSEFKDFMKWVRDAKSRVARKLGERVFIDTDSQAVLTITPQVTYCYDGLIESRSTDIIPEAIELDENLIFLTLNIVREYDKILGQTLDAKSSVIYRLLTDLPIPYGLAPKRLRDLLVKTHGEQKGSTFCDRLPLDALRFILAKTMEKVSEKKLRRRTWNGKRYACVVTHDVDTRKGLHRARHLKKLEEEYNVPSAWYIPSDCYNLNLETIEELANFGEVGAHDTRHDGKLSQLPEEKIVKRLREVKQTLEKIINCSVEGFRAPLLQHSSRILRGVKEAGFIYDTSIPTWEPKHPRTMCSHGLGTTYPIFLDGITEIPVSAVQDHQLFYVLGLEPKEALAEWLSMMAQIGELGGCCVLLSHPEYKFFDKNNLAVYEELLNVLSADEQVWLTTPKHLARAQNEMPLNSCYYR